MANKDNKSIYETLREDILYLHLQPGVALGETELAERFNVSRTPIRTVISQLESEGYIEVKPHVGTFVTKIDLDRISDAIFIREHIEVGICEDIIKNKIDISKLESSILRQKNLLITDKDDVSNKFLRLDNEFHKTIYELDDRIGVWTMLQTAQSDYQRFRSFIHDYQDDSNIEELIEDHIAIVKAIKEKDKEALFKAYDNHLYRGIKEGTKAILDHLSYFAHGDGV